MNDAVPALGLTLCWDRLGLEAMEPQSICNAVNLGDLCTMRYMHAAVHPFRMMILNIVLNKFDFDVYIKNTGNIMLRIV
jgi:hypothetical protein